MREIENENGKTVKLVDKSASLQYGMVECS